MLLRPSVAPRRALGLRSKTPRAEGAISTDSSSRIRKAWIALPPVPKEWRRRECWKHGRPTLSCHDAVWPGVARMAKAYNGETVVAGGIPRLGVPGIRLHRWCSGVMAGRSTARLVGRPARGQAKSGPAAPSRLAAYEAGTAASGA